MSTTTATAARNLVRLVEAEDVLTAARRELARAAGVAERAAARVLTARTLLAEARKDLRTAERAGKGVKAATRRVTTREARLQDLVQAARDAKATASAARRAVRTAERRVERTARRAALAATRSVEKIAAALGETALAPAPETDRLLAADEIPAVEEIETHAARYAELDRQAKDLAKLADAEKTWLRQLPNGTYGRVVINRTPGRSVLDGAAVALAYTARGEVPPRKATRTTFKCDATALLEDLAAAEAATPTVLAIAA
jgi:vacuolar-type H+-ATPase subunit I/STV1